MDWSKTRKAKVSPFRDTPPIYLRIFSRRRSSDVALHALLSLKEDPDKMVTITGSHAYVEEVKPLVEGHKVRLLNFQKAVHAAHQGLLLVAEPESQPDMRRMFDLVTQIKADIAEQKDIV